MELEIKHTDRARSLTRRWNVTGAEPVVSHARNGSFEPAELQIWWMISDSSSPGGRTRYSIYAWPAERHSHDSQSWGGVRDRPYSEDMPDWVCTLADELYEELTASVKDRGL